MIYVYNIQELDHIWNFGPERIVQIGGGYTKVQEPKWNVNKIILGHRGISLDQMVASTAFHIRSRRQYISAIKPTSTVLVGFFSPEVDALLLVGFGGRVTPAGLLEFVGTLTCSSLKAPQREELYRTATSR
jgi:hypothetical protein